MRQNLYKIAKSTRASQDQFELWQLLIILEQINPMKILEIGVHRGGMIETLKQAFPASQIVGVDNDFSALLFDDFIRVEGDSHNIAVRDAAVGAQMYALDFLFIDGDHNYEGVKADFDMYAQYVRPGGLIAFHDIMRDPQAVPHHAGVDCRRFFDEVKSGYRNIEIWNGVAGINGPGIGVLFV